MLDTNVVLAALLSKRGASFEILQRLRRAERRRVPGNHLLPEQPILTFLPLLRIPAVRQD